MSTDLHFLNGRHNTAKIQHCSISKVAFDLFFKPVVSGRIFTHFLCRVLAAILKIFPCKNAFKIMIITSHMQKIIQIHPSGLTKPGEVGDFFALVSMKSPNFCQKAKFQSVFLNNDLKRMQLTSLE
jgi:hypothetical protein